MESQPKPPALDYDNFLEIIKRRRSVRRFEKGKKVERETLMKIAEAGRWAPTGANAQCWDLLIVDEPETRQGVLDVFLRQSQRLVDHAKGFPAVKKTYLANTVAIFVVLGDARFKACFPQATTAEWAREYEANNERIFLASLGAAIQNIQLAVTACGLTSAWLSGGGEDKTNEELAALSVIRRSSARSARFRSALRKRTSAGAIGGRSSRLCTGTTMTRKNSGPTR
jgi:nitroreductase